MAETLKEIGGMLRAERERQNLSVDQIMERTKLSRLNIEAMEEGRVEHMPHPVYAKGFIRNYAQVLGLDPHSLLDGYAPTLPADELHNPYDVPGRPAGRSPGLWATIGSVGVLLLLAAGGYLLTGGRLETYIPNLFGGTASRVAPPVNHLLPGPTVARPPAPPATQPIPPAQAQPEPEPARPQPPSSSTVPAPGIPPVPHATAQPKPDASVAKPTVQMDGPTSTPAAPATSTTSSTTSSPAPQSAPVAASITSGLRIATIRAVEACWMQARYPDGRLREFYLKPGDTTQVEFRGSMDLKLGNAGGVRISIDGQDVPFDGASGQVRTVKLH